MKKRRGGGCGEVALPELVRPSSAVKFTPDGTLQELRQTLQKVFVKRKESITTLAGMRCKIDVQQVVKVGQKGQRRDKCQKGQSRAKEKHFDYFIHQILVSTRVSSKLNLACTWKSFPPEEAQSHMAENNLWRVIEIWNCVFQERTLAQAEEWQGEQEHTTVGSHPRSSACRVLRDSRLEDTILDPKLFQASKTTTFPKPS
ncbi:hypothetical protein WISP_121266 [Willisornis vidua]|uniref:Uncharacterized protein n=1 Tax=Willisornis vidua TaxID=1566151 RepID=A0ABQ9CSG8_9PASS|nr:hypothetical protein WISP_121266 [Willisornis vidua]